VAKDTLWASGYELFDRISPILQRFLEGLTATFAQPAFKQTAEHNGQKLYAATRGAPENVGDILETIHPVIRTNPVTGWKSVSQLQSEIMATPNIPCSYLPLACNMLRASTD
jgi:alpha-ketoglutarate-dependent taurine dioxygenase